MKYSAFIAKWFFSVLWILVLVDTTSAQLDFVKIQFTPIQRTQISGPNELILPSDFHHIDLFDSESRFAPDEPSSFSSIEFGFKPKNQKSKLRPTLGMFRNHLKGDVLLDATTIHFGRGHSHFGIISSLGYDTPILKSSFDFKLSYRLGIGPIVTQFQNDNLTLTPASWGINGYGLVSNVDFQIKSPLIFNRMNFFIGSLLNFTFVKLKTIQWTDPNNDNRIFDDISFITRNKIPSLSFGIVVNFSKPKVKT